RLKRGVVVDLDPLVVDIDGNRRPAWADIGKVGPVALGDEVVVNVSAVDLGLGSGGFDIVHVNLTAGLAAEPVSDAHVMKLNYTSLQLRVEPVELAADAPRAGRGVAVVASPHGQLAPIAWAAKETRPDLRLGYVQVAGGALPGGFSRDVRRLLDDG